jgi:hypothetical protein
LHHAVAHLAEHAGALGPGGWIVRLAEPAFTVAAVGTAAALAKLLGAALLGRPASDAVRGARAAPWPARIATGVGAAAVIVLSVRPQSLAPLIDAGRVVWGLGPGDARADLTAWSGDPFTIATALATIVGGVVAYRVAAALDLDAGALPAWASWDRIVTAAATRLYRVVLGATRPREASLDDVTRRAWQRWWTGQEAGPAEAVTPAAPRPERGPVGVRLVDRLARAFAPLAAWTRRIDASGRLREPGEGPGAGARDDARAAARDRWVRSNRSRIERLARDIGLDVGWVVAAALAFVLALALGTPGAG